MMVLVTGGSKSGKSSFAEMLARRLASGLPLIYVATMQVWGEEEQAIVRRHQQAREGKGFIVLEQARKLASLALPEAAVLLLEDVPNLLANEMFGGQGPQQAVSGIGSLAARCRHLVLVTNQVGSDGCSYPTETESYIQALGHINCQLAAQSDCLVEVVCGLPLVLKWRLP